MVVWLLESSRKGSLAILRKNGGECAKPRVRKRLSLLWPRILSHGLNLDFRRAFDPPTRHCRRLSDTVATHVAPVLRAQWTSQQSAPELRISPRTTANGRGRGAGAGVAQAFDRGSRHGHGQNSRLLAAGHPQRQARDYFHRHQEPSGAALLLRHSLPVAAPGQAAGMLKTG